jgi:serine acetyltransferase
MNAGVIGGVTVGAWSTVGAGASVVRDVPPNVTAVGVPARVLPRR